jgi:hypothetical protein
MVFGKKQVVRAVCSMVFEKYRGALAIGSMVFRIGSTAFGVCSIANGICSSECLFVSETAFHKQGRHSVFSPFVFRLCGESAFLRLSHCGLRVAWYPPCKRSRVWRQ